MERSKFSREFKIEAAKIVSERRVSVAQASRDMDVHQTVLRKWVKELSGSLREAFTGHGQMKPEQQGNSGYAYCARLGRRRPVLRRVVGWSMSATMTAQLVTDALIMAIWRRGKPDALLHRSDQGSQYTSEQFQRLMKDNDVTCSMSRSGNCWDNAAMESFFSSLKTERIRRKVYRSRDQAQADMSDYIERFYNPTCRHATLGYPSPIDFQTQAGVA